MTCRGICNFSEFRISPHRGMTEPSVKKRFGFGPYSVDGVKFCITCEVFFQTENKFVLCPCCHAKMRARSRYKQAREERVRKWEAKVIA